jgi:MFS superfamily sulfate permease-like transporter
MVDCASPQVASVISALLVLMALNFATSLFFYIPMCSLAAMIAVGVLIS